METPDGLSIYNSLIPDAKKTRSNVVHKNVSQDFKMLSFWESLEYIKI